MSSFGEHRPLTAYSNPFPATPVDPGQPTQPQQPGQSPVRAAVADLTPREREVLALVCQGRSDAEIAAELGLARTTARNHVVSLYRKLGVNRRSALVVWARERGIGGDGVPPKRLKGRKRSSSEPV